MQNLNLININKSDIKYEIINFSDGETHLKLTTDVNRKDNVTVITRISSWVDLMNLMQVGDILKRMEVEFDLKITYLLTMRMDRVISFNEAYSLKIVANMINSIHPHSVEIVEPHSHKSLDLIEHSYSHDMIGIWEALFIKKNIETGDENTNKVCIVFPDAGAKERYTKTFNHCIPIITCKKVRDTNTGKLLSFEIENPEVIELYQIKEFVVIDDLCDNGGTFIGISNLLSKYPNIKKKIAVTHMVNPNGIKNLSENYDEVYFTNSYKNWEDEIDMPYNVSVVSNFNFFFKN